MRIVVDENIPYSQEIFGHLGEVIPVSGRLLSKTQLEEAQALVVRSVTPVNQKLLSGTPVQFVGTTTAGIDHIDCDWLRLQNIQFASAPGCNAKAVVEYVLSAVMVLAERNGFLLGEKTVGLVGVGHVGSVLNQRLKALNVKTLLCDPPRKDKGDEGPFVPLERLVREADILTFHTPLKRSGMHQTWHMVDDTFLAALPQGRLLINTARGAIFDNTALLRAVERGKHISLVLDVWENEPSLLLPLLNRVDIGTPHIAGYSMEGKVMSTLAIYSALCRYFGKEERVELSQLLPKPSISYVTLQGSLNETLFKRLIHLVYDVRRDDAPLRRMIGCTGEFDCLRKFYSGRREWSSLVVGCNSGEDQELLKQIGFNSHLL